MMQQEYSKEFKEQSPVSFQYMVGHSWKNLACEPHRLFPACLQGENCVSSVRKEKKLKMCTSSGHSLMQSDFQSEGSSCQHGGDANDQVLRVHNVNKLNISSYYKTTSTTTVSESLLALSFQYKICWGRPKRWWDTRVTAAQDGTGKLAYSEGVLASPCQRPWLAVASEVSSSCYRDGDHSSMTKPL